MSSLSSKMIDSLSSQCVIVMDTMMCATIPVATVCVWMLESLAAAVLSARQQRISVEMPPIFASVSSSVVKRT